MSSSFGKPDLPMYRPEGAMQTPYRDGQREWDARMGTTLVHAENWRRIAFLSIIALLLTLAGFIYYANKATVIPYIVERGPKGEVRLVGKVTEQPWSIGLSEKQLILTRFIESIRALSTDEHVYLSRVTFAQSHTSDAGRILLNAYYEKEQRNLLFGKERRLVHIELITPFQDSEDSFRVQWNEEIYGIDSRLIGKEAYIGEFHTVTRRPTTAEEITLNPLGIHVDFFNIQKTQTR